MNLDDTWVLDFETTGLDPKECKPCEISLIPVNSNLTPRWEGLINPGVSIPPETSAVHHILDKNVETAITWEIQKQQLAAYFEGRTPLPIFVAHNCAYEKDVLGDFPPVIWICTYKCSLRIWPDAPSHKNEVLRYWLGLGDNRGRNAYQNPHSAGHDTRVTRLLLLALLEHATLAQLVEWTELPAKLPKVPFGMHRGKLWSDVPEPYFQWMFKQTDMNPDVIFCAREELTRRRTQGAATRSS